MSCRARGGFGCGCLPVYGAAVGGLLARAAHSCSAAETVAGLGSRISGLYDDLDPRSLDTGIVRFDGRHFGALWDLCRRRDLTVVADVHVHPGSAGQSQSDQAHPMITRSGHLALIIPRFAGSPVRRSEIGIYRYLGARRWETIPPQLHRAFFHIGF